MNTKTMHHIASISILGAAACIHWWLHRGNTEFAPALLVCCVGLFVTTMVGITVEELRKPR